MAPAPIPARELGFDPAGGLWLASTARLVHVAPGESFGPCDDRAPTVRVSPSRAVSAEGAARGVFASSSASLPRSKSPASPSTTPAAIRAAAAPFVSRVMPRAGALRYRVPAANLRAVRPAARRAASGRSSACCIAVTDPEGNRNVVQRTVRVRR